MVSSWRRFAALRNVTEGVSGKTSAVLLSGPMSLGMEPEGRHEECGQLRVAGMICAMSLAAEIEGKLLLDTIGSGVGSLGAQLAR